MIFQVQIILPRLLEERIEQRAATINSLVYWLQANKPMTAREQWACPTKVCYPSLNLSELLCLLAQATTDLNVEWVWNEIDREKMLCEKRLGKNQKSANLSIRDCRN